MSDVEKKPAAYFIMHEEEPDVHSFLRMAQELLILGFDDYKFQRVMILTPVQMRHLLNSIDKCFIPLPSHENFHLSTCAGFMLRTLYGKIE